MEANGNSCSKTAKFHPFFKNSSIPLYVQGVPKNARSWHFGYNSTLEMARNKGRVCFEKFRKFSILCFCRDSNIQNLDIIVQHKFKHFRDRVSKISVPLKNSKSSIFSTFFRQGCHLQTQFSLLQIGQIENFGMYHIENFLIFSKHTLPLFLVLSKVDLYLKSQEWCFFGTPCRMSKQGCTLNYTQNPHSRI